MPMSEMYLHNIPVTKTAQGRIRRVGIELEFTGLSLHIAADVLKLFTGELTRHSLVVWTGAHPQFGDFQLELDWDYLKRLAAEQSFDPERDSWAEFVQETAALLVPIEVVCPPIPIDQLDQLDRLVTLFREHGAQGTDDSILAAYGVHLNVEIPSMDANQVLQYLQAFCLLQWWLSEAHQVDFTRKLSPYVNLFSEVYVRQVLRRRETNWSSLMSDYMAHNNTRNRALDMYPIFAEYDEQRVRQNVPDPRIKKRPAFHYRLPNCEIDRPDWSLQQPWSLWCVVERLAHDVSGIESLSQKFMQQERFILGLNRREWIDYLDQWLRDRSLV